MKKEVKDKLDQIRNSMLMTTNIAKSYHHSVSLNGWLVQKPTIHYAKRWKNQIPVIGFILFQVKDKGHFSIPCQTYSKVLIDKMLSQNNVCLVNCLGKLTYNRKMTISFTVEDLQITHELVEMPLEPPYEPVKKEKK